MSEFVAHPLIRYLISSLSFLVILIAFSVLGGWILQQPALIQIFPDFPPMQFNTALGFLFCATALFSGVYGYRKLAFVLGLLGFALGAGTLSQYILNIDLSLDALFFKETSFVMTLVSHPGRMAVNTALNFTLSGLFLLLAFGGKFRFRLLLQIILSSMVFSIGSISLIGYWMGGVKSYIAWMGFTGMALHTSLNFILLGGGFILFSWHKENGTMPVAFTVIFGSLITLHLCFSYMNSYEGLQNENTWVPWTITITGFFLTFSLAGYLAYMFSVRKQLQYLNQQLLNSIRHQEAAAKDLDILNKTLEERIQVRTHELQKSEAFARALIQASPHGKILVDKAGAIKFLNKAAERLFQYSEQELVGKEVEVLIPGEFRGGHQKHRRDYAQNPVERPMLKGKPLFGRRKDGVSIPLEIALSPVFFENEVMILAAIVDITERYEADKTISQLSYAVEQSSSVILITDTKGNIEYVNPKFVEVTGYGREKAIGHNPRILKSGKMPDAVYKDLWDTITAGKEWRGEVINRKRNGEFYWALASISPIRNMRGEVTHFVGVQEDITDRKNKEEEIKKFSEELKRSNQELERFAYISSHDLQEPLRKITSFGRLLRQSDVNQLNDEAKDYLSRMEDAASRMSRLINDLLQYSRVTMKEKTSQQVDLNLILKEVLSDLEVKVRETAAEIKIGTLPLIHGDPIQMQQLFQNLIGNALKFMKLGVPPAVEITCSQPPETKFYRIEIKDNGIGFEEKYKDRIFEVFQRLHTRTEYEGTGIGLSICQKIVERHNGSIEVKSKLGEGTTFVVCLPRV